MCAWESAVAAAARQEDVAGGGAPDCDHPRVPGLDGDRGGRPGRQRPGAGLMSVCVVIAGQYWYLSALSPDEGFKVALHVVQCA